MQPRAWAFAFILVVPVLVATLAADAPVLLEDAPAPGTGAFAPASLAGPAPGSGRLLVGFTPGGLPALVPGQTFGGMIVLDATPQLDVLVLQGDDLSTALALLATRPDVRYVEADGVAFALATPNDPRFDRQPGLRLAGLPDAWATAGYGSAAVTIAVLDSGVDGRHPDLQGPRLLAGHDYVNRDGLPNDDCGHGTHVTGIAAASTDNGVGVAGASQATVMPLKVLGAGCSGSLSNIAKAVVEATDQGARIITMSFGTSTDTRTLAAAVAYAWDHGVVLVASAGNGGRDNSVQFPASYPQVIAVSAVDASKRLASYSSRGPQVEIAAPGSSIDSTTAGGGYGLMSGTSMAAPHVAGILALALSCAPDTTNHDLRTRLAATAEDLGTPGRDASFGFGLARADRLVADLCPGTLPPAEQSPPTPTTTSTTTTTTSTTTTTTTTTTSSPGPVADPVPPAGFTAQFTPSKGCNEWWVDITVVGSSAPVAVSAQVNGGLAHALPKTSWGTWATSFYVAKGSTVVIEATNAAGDTAHSAPFSWLGPAAAPATGPFTASFAPRAVGNDWWIESAVSANQGVTKVEAKVGSGAWTVLPATDWGTYAKSINAPNRSQVTFRATNAAGTTVTSAAVIWT